MELAHVQMFGIDGWVLFIISLLHRIKPRVVEIPLADAGSLTTGPSADGQIGFEMQRVPKPSWRIGMHTRPARFRLLTSAPGSLARIIVYSMAPDGIAVSPSTSATPSMTPSASGMNTPQIHSNNLGDYLSAPLAKSIHSKPKTYLAGCKALDSLAKMIASTESFFHPSNSGAWTADVCHNLLSLYHCHEKCFVS